MWTGCVPSKALLAAAATASGAREIDFLQALLATGASPTVPDIDGLGSSAFVTSDSISDVEELPERLVVVGGGPIGCELGQEFARLGS